MGNEIQNVNYGVEVKEIQFYDDTLLGVRTDDGKLWLGVKRACKGIGLTEAQADAEVKKIQKAELYQNQHKKIPVKFDGQVREVLVLLKKFVPMWLAQINITPNMKKNNPEAAKKLLAYQLECADVLYKAFTGTDSGNGLAIQTGLELLRDEMQKGFGKVQAEFDGCKKAVQILYKNQVGMMSKINQVESEMGQVHGVVKKLEEEGTINYRQQNILLNEKDKRMRELLGNTHGTRYKENGRIYQANFWKCFRTRFGVDSYKDLHPKDMGRAVDYIKKWEYVE